MANPNIVANPEVDSSGNFDNDEWQLEDETIDLIANNPVFSHFDNDEWQLEDETELTEREKGWRLERNSNGYYRWRWQMKDESGDPITYITSSGNTGYKRGSKYVGKK